MQIFNYFAPTMVVCFNLFPWNNMFRAVNDIHNLCTRIFTVLYPPLDKFLRTPLPSLPVPRTPSWILFMFPVYVCVHVYVCVCVFFLWTVNKIWKSPTAPRKHLAPRLTDDRFSSGCTSKVHTLPGDLWSESADDTRSFGLIYFFFIYQKHEIRTEFRTTAHGHCRPVVVGRTFWHDSPCKANYFTGQRVSWWFFVSDRVRPGSGPRIGI